MSTVYVCAEKDIACGDNPANWCKRCPARDAMDNKPSLSAMSTTDARTGWPPGMLQDDSRELSKALAGKPDAMRHARDAAQAIATDALPPLPETDVSWVDGRDKWGYNDYATAYSADAMQAYAHAALAAQAEELAVLRADAERYRWLREFRAVTLDVMLHGNGCSAHTAEEIDAAIDAARTGGKG